MLICNEFSVASNKFFVILMLLRCRILDISMDELQHNFNTEASETIKHPSNYARNFLEYCCFRALALSTQVTGYLSDLKFRRLTFDMMLAWEAPSVKEASFKVNNWQCLLFLLNAR